MFKDKKILLTAYSLGSTSEEVSLYNYLKSRGATSITTLYWGDEAHKAQIPEDITAIEIKDAFSTEEIDFSPYDLIFRHPTTRPSQLPHSTAITSATRYFFDHCPAQIIGVTGTKGKGTTATLISKLLEATGNNVHLLGNIGIPALDKLDDIQSDDLVVMELSSFQLWDIEKSPHIAVILMVAEDHQDVHTSVEEYIEAKHGIVQFQSKNDLAYVHPTNELSHQVLGQTASQVKKYLSPEAANVEGEKIVIDGQEVCSTNEVGLIGKHNLENICAALSVAWNFTQDVASSAAVLKDFKGLEHRLEEVREVDGVRFINDTFSASVPAAIAAVKAFEQPKIIIFGGSSKGASYDELAVAVSESEVKALLIGETARDIANSFEQAGIQNFEILNDVTMDDIVQKALEIASSGEVVVLSPGCASFDMFENYKDRGNQFKAAVNNLK